MLGVPYWGSFSRGSYYLRVYNAVPYYRNVQALSSTATALRNKCIGTKDSAELHILIRALAL